MSRSDWLKAASVALVYVAAAKVGIELSVAHGVVTPVWAPSGISLAALLLFGHRMWLGVALGALVANATSDISFGLAAAIAVGNTLEAVVGAYLLRRIGFDTRLARVRDVLALVAFGALLSTTIAATNGVTALLVGGEIQGSSYGSEWLLWWFGDAVGDLLVAPVLLVWFTKRRDETHPRDALEAAALLVGLVGTSVVVFLGGRWRLPYLLFPLLVWASVRFKQRGAATAIFVVGAIGTWGTVEGAVPVGGATATQSVQILQALVAVVGISCLAMAASLSERDDVQEELRAAHSRLADAADRLGETSEMKNTFMAAVSHDLRTPLATIRGLTHAVKLKIDGLPREEMLSVLDSIDSSAKRATQMLTNLLDVDRVTSGVVQPSRTPVDLLQLVDRAVASSDLGGRSVEVSGDPVTVDVDQTLIERMVDNLLANANRYTPAGSPIWVRVLDDAGVTIEVDDAGPGVPDAKKEEIFEAFQGSGGGIGTGIGLFLVARFAQLHGGRAWVEDRPGGGASFRIFLPKG